MIQNWIKVGSENPTICDPLNSTFRNKVGSNRIQELILVLSGHSLNASQEFANHVTGYSIRLGSDVAKSRNLNNILGVRFNLLRCNYSAVVHEAGIGETFDMTNAGEIIAV